MSLESLDKSSENSAAKSEPEGISGPSTGPFLRSNRLLDSKDYLRVMRRGRRRASRDLVVISAKRSEKPIDSNTLREELPGPSNPGTGLERRLGITASRKLGNAVVRNRFKRRIRSWFRHRRNELEEGLDLVVIARPSAASLSLDQLDERLSPLLGLTPAPERIR